ncbi:MAG: hypothetical protein JJU03_07435 [Idiomarina sp.]|nr:hypothetical protein [Idiomarina sp.]
MVTQQITAIALRILSIWLLIHLLLSLPGMALTFPSFEIFHQQETPKWMLFGVSAALFALGLLAVFLLFKTSKSVLTHSKSDFPLALNEDSQKVLFQLAGLYFVVNALAYLPRSLAPISSAFELSMGDFLTPVGLLLQLLIGVWLASRSAFWLKLFQKLRGRG